MSDVKQYINVLGEIGDKVEQLSALLSMCHVGMEQFKELSYEKQGNLLWLATDLAEQIKNAVNGVQ